METHGQILLRGSWPSSDQGAPRGVFSGAYPWGWSKRALKGGGFFGAITSRSAFTEATQPLGPKTIIAALWPGHCSRGGPEVN